VNLPVPADGGSEGPIPAGAALAPAPASGALLRSETVQSASVQSESAATHAAPTLDYWSMLFVFVLSTFIGLGVIKRVSRLLHTPLMSLTNAISAIAVVGAILVAGGEFPLEIKILGAIALFASVTNIVSGFLITDRMLKMLKDPKAKAARVENGLQQGEAKK